MRCHAILESLRVLCIARQPGLAVAGIERGIVDRLRPWVTVGPDVVVIHLVVKRRRQRRRQRYQSECGGKDEFFHRRSPLPIRSPRAEKGFWGLPKFKGREGAVVTGPWLPRSRTRKIAQAYFHPNNVPDMFHAH